MYIRNLLGVIRKPTPGAAVLRKQLDELPSMIAAGETELKKLEATRRRLLIEGTDEELAGIDAQIAKVNVDLDRAFAARDELKARLVEVESDEAEEARQKRYEQAKRAAAEAEKEIKAYPTIALKLVSLLGNLARAELLVNEANADLPSGQPKLESPEMRARGLPPQPEQIVSTEIKSAGWLFSATGRPVPENELSRIQTADNRVGRIGEDSKYGGWVQDVEYRPAKRLTTYLPPQAAFKPVPLAASISLPGFKPGQPELWTACGGIEPSLWPQEAIGQATEAAISAKAPVTDPRRVREPATRVEPLPTAGDDAA